MPNGTAVGLHVSNIDALGQAISKLGEKPQDFVSKNRSHDLDQMYDRGCLPKGSEIPRQMALTSFLPCYTSR